MSTTDPEAHPDPVRAAIAVLDDVIAANHEARQNLLAILGLFDTQGPPATVGEGLPPASLPPAGELRFERLITADSMEAGGALRLTTGRHPNVWHEIGSVERTSKPDTRVVHLADGESVLVDSATTYPYLTPAEWSPEEALPTGCVRVALCVLDDGHAGDCVDARGDTYQGWAA